MKRIKIFDIIIILAALAVGLGLLFASGFSSDSSGDRLCVIKVDGEEMHRINLSSVIDDEVIDISTEYGENKILVNPDGVKVTYSDCPRKIEMTENPISKPGQSLVCLPHRLIIEIIGGETTPDAVSY